MSSLFEKSSLQPATSPSEPSTATETPQKQPSTAIEIPEKQPSTAIETPQKRRRLCLTICTTRKPGLSEEEFGEYLIKVHAQLSKGLLAKYGMIRWTMAHNTTETRALLPKIYGPNFANVVPYDCFSQAVFEDVDRVVSMTQDPYYKEYIRHDPVKFADSENTRISIGWLEDHIMDGKVIE